MNEILVKDSGQFITDKLFQRINGLFILLNQENLYIDLVNQFSPIAAFGFDERIGSNSGTIVEAEGTYINPAIRVFRSDGEISSFPQENLEYQLSSWCQPNLSATAWVYDVSGNGYDMIQTNAAKRPTVVTNGVLNRENFNMALNFDGVDDFLRNITSNWENVTDGNYSIFIVHELSTITNKISISIGDGSGDDVDLLVGSGSISGKYDYRTKEFQREFTGRSTSGIGIFYLTNMISEDSFLNDVAQNSTTTFTGTSPNSDRLTLGSRRTGTESFFSGNILSLLVFDSDQSDNREIIQNKLEEIYGV